MPNTYDMSYTQNRELSWLAFNKRVLEQAIDPTIPPLEKLVFIAIFTSNLEEFFMVRVGSLFDLASLKREGYDNKTGWTYTEQLERVYETMPEYYALRDRIFDQTMDELKNEGVHYLRYEELDKSDQKYADLFFDRNILPVLSPLIIDAHHPFPHLTTGSLYAVCEILTPGKPASLGIVGLPAILEKALILPETPFRYILTEDLIQARIRDIFSGFTVQSPAIIRVTRNADINLEEEIDDADENFRQLMKKALKKRARLAPVRLEIQGNISKDSTQYLQKQLNLQKNQIYASKAPLSLDFVSQISDHLSAEKKKNLNFSSFVPIIPPDIDINRSMTEQVYEKDRLLHFPYESMDPFLQLLKEASRDPAVISIKITIYRLTSISKVAEYLAGAAENGKEVTVLMELRARFDEKNNIDWSERLEHAGCTIVYGFEDYKVHSKVCLITRHENNKISYITQIGTGNYNEKTAKQYTDYSYITSNQEIGKDAARFFKNMLISKLEDKYNHLLVAPYGMLPAINSLIDKEIEKASSGGEGRIVIKCNSVTERGLIDKLSEASRAGVRVSLIARGICCILPKIPGKTDNIRVTSIVGRYLEHHRIYVFGSGAVEDVKVYISSADWMTRNISRRVEIACPIYDPVIIKRILDDVELFLADDLKAMELQPDGTYRKVEKVRGIGAQDTMLAQAEEKRLLVAEKTRRREVKKASTFSPAVDSKEEKIIETPQHLSLWQRILQFFRGK